jgi:hypothetical protein
VNKPSNPGKWVMFWLVSACAGLALATGAAGWFVAGAILDGSRESLRQCVSDREAAGRQLHRRDAELDAELIGHREDRGRLSMCRDELVKCRQSQEPPRP